MKSKKFHGWSVFAGCLILMIFPGGMLSYTAGLFMYPICAEFGFSTTAYSFSLTLSSGVNALVSAFLAGYLSKGSRNMMKLIMGAAVIIVSCGFAAQSFCSQLWQFYLAAAVWNTGYSLLTFIPVTMLISNWFVKKRELLTGIAIAFGNLGGAISNALVSQIIASQGWRTAYLLSGGLSLVFCLCAVLFLLRRSPAEYGEAPYGVEPDSKPGNQTSAWMGVDKKTALRQPAFYILCIVMLLTGIYGAGISNHVVNYLCINGWEVGAAGFVMTVFTLAGIIGSTAGGSILAKLGYRRTICAGGAVALLSVIILACAKTIPAMAYLFAVLLGLSCFMIGLLPSMSVSNTFGLRDYAGIYGLSYSFYLIGCAISTPVIAMVAEKQSYMIAWSAVALCIVVIVALHMYCIKAGEKFRKEYPD